MSKIQATGDTADTDRTKVPTLVDSSRVRELPTTQRGLRTRSALVAAARTVFERDGFLGARLTDITAEAHCSVGTFYTYFDSKEEIFTALMQDVQDEMMHPGLPRLPEDSASIQQIIAASNRAYLESYRRNAKLMVLLEQVSTIDPKFRTLRLERSAAFANRNADRIAWLQEHGLADATLDPKLTARALSGMISRTAYISLAMREDVDVDELSDTITKLWFNALGVPPDSRS